MKKIFTIALTTLCFSFSNAHALESGDFILRFGLTTVAPDESSGDVIVDGSGTGFGATLNNDTQLGLNFVYGLNAKWAVELLAATPFEHELSLKNAGGLDGKLATAKHLPPTLSALYYFGSSDSNFQPYAGIGINYTIFFSEEFTSTREGQGFSNPELDSSLGLAVQAGFDHMLNDKWMLNGSIRYIDISTTAEFELGSARGSVDVDIDPWVYTLALGYKF